MKPETSQQQISGVITKTEMLNFPVHLNRQNSKTSIEIILNGHNYLVDDFKEMSCTPLEYWKNAP